MKNNYFLKHTKILLLFLFFVNQQSFAQYAIKHYIAPAPWNYASDANEFIVSTTSASAVSVIITKSDGTAVTTLSVIAGTPVAYRPTGSPVSLAANSINTVYTDRGLIFTCAAPIAVSIRNVESDQVNGGRTNFIKGNAALSSYGNEAPGNIFRLGYYRSNYAGLVTFSSSAAAPVYSVMAINNGTAVAVNGTILVNLNAGESYLFQTTLGNVVTTNKPVVMNSGTWGDLPGGCTDAVFDEIPPVRVLGQEYIIIRGAGTAGTATNLPEQTTFVATEPNTTVVVKNYNVAGTQISTNTYTLLTAGSFQTIHHGDAVTAYSSTSLLSDKKIAVYSGTAQGCEVDMSVLPPMSSCTGSFRAETKKFTNYTNSNLPYFGCVLIKDSTTKVFMNGLDLEALGGVRRQIGTTGFYLIDFTNVQLANPVNIIFTSAARMTISMVQQGGGFSMAAYLSSFNDTLLPPTPTSSSNGCVTLLTAEPGLSPYQWYLNDVLIAGATGDTYAPTSPGNYSVAGTKPCGLTAPSLSFLVGCSANPDVNAGNVNTIIAGNVATNDEVPVGTTYGLPVGQVGNPNAVLPIFNSNGTYTFTPTLSGVYTFLVDVCLPAAVAPCPKELLVITVLNPLSNVNPPVATNDIVTAVFNTQVVIPVTANDGPGNTGGVIGIPTILTQPPISAGVVTIVAGKPVFTPTIGFTGVTTFVYQICENPSGLCAPATVEVTVLPLGAANTNNATDDYNTATHSIAANGNVSTNDIDPEGNSQTVSPQNLTTPKGTFILASTGVYTFTPSAGFVGSIDFPYTTCDNGVPSYCVTATLHIVVTSIIDAVNDPSVTIASNNTVVTALNALANDTLSNIAATTTNTNVTLLTTGPLSINADGIVTVAANTPSGTYSITYQLCEANPATGLNVTPANCDTATATVVVANAIDAVADPSVTIASNNTVVTALNALANDTRNGVAVTTTNTNVTPLTTGPLSINADGIVTVAANTPSGTYSITYQLCEANPATGLNVSPANCDTATATVVVNNPIDAVADPSVTVASNNTVVTALNALANDTLSGIAVTTTNTKVTPLITGPLSIDADGIVTVAANTPSGTYSITYQLCEANPSTGLNVTPANCDIATATVVVFNPIDAVNDGPTTIASATTPVTVQNVTSNDRLNGVFVTATNSDVTPITTGPLSVDVDGNLIVAPNTVSGTYSITYQLCESGSSPVNCDTAVATVVVQNPLLAVNDGPITVATANVPKVVLNVTSNDTLHGDLVTDANTNVTPQIAGTLSIASNGDITLAANTPSGTYTITYEICEVGASPVNCKTATATIVVLNPIVANPDTTGGLPGATTGSVLGNDTLSGIPPIDPADVILTTTGPNTALTLNPDGTITIAPGTPAGPQTLTYQICEIGSSPANCSTAIVTVNVSQAAVDAIVDDFTAVPYTGGIGGTTTSVLNNDTLNGTILNPADVVLTLSGTAPADFVLNSDGTITVPPAQVSGTYMVFYQICEKINSSNCEIANAKILISNQINAFDDTFATQVPSTTVATTVGNILSNNGNGADNLNGIAVTSANTDVTPITTGPLSIDADGNLTLAPNTVSGTYSITYQLCETGADPINCTTATATVVVVNPINAIDDTPVAVNTGVNSITVLNVTDNDTLNNVKVTPTNTNVTPVSEGPLSIDSNGVLTLAGNTPSGSYAITYELCEANPSTGLNVIPANCTSAIATITVLNPIDAVDDPSVTVISNNAVVTVLNALTNDTLNGVAAATTNSNVTPLTTGPLSIDANGIVTVAANTPSGSYSITYQLCEADSSTGLSVTPANCDSATVTVVVANSIDAVNDPSVSISSSNTTITALNVLVNDTLNGVLVTTINTNVTPLTTGPLSIDADGIVTLAANTPSGTYTITYELCESGTTPANSNCDTATATVVVANSIDANNDTPIAVTTGDSSASVVANDTLNGNPVVIGTNPGQVSLTGVTVPAGLTLNANGTITVNANTPSGTYTVVYEICEVGANPINCAQASVTIVVANPIVANDDAPIAVTAGETTANILANDTLDGVINPTIGTNPGNVTLSGITVPAGLTLNGDGTITVNANTPSGTYTVVYEICEVGATPAPPGNCDQANVTIVVANPIVANDDAPVAVTAGDTTPNIVANDTLDGVLNPTIGTNPGNVTLSGITVPVGLTLNGDGTITVNANTPSGTYTVVYEICEVGANPINCDQAIATVVVANPIVANNNTFSSTGGNVTGNDTLNGVPVTTANTDVTPVTNGPLSIDANGNLTVAPNTPSGTYTITYQICEVGATPANCTTATATVVVNNVIVANNDTLPATGGNVLANDTINGVPVTAANTDVTPVTSGPLSIDANGNLTVAPNTIAGTYTITYQVCETGSNPLSCTTATVTVVIAETPMIAIVKTAVFNDENGDGFAQAGETITYSFAVSNTGNTPLNNVTVTDVLPGLILSGNSISLLPVGATNNTAYQGVYRLKQSDINLGSVTNQATATGVTPLGLVVSDLSDDSSALSDRPTVLAIQGCVIEVFNAVAPNGNGDNKVFRIRGLECYSDNTVEIYNRWGVLVFERTGYNNDDRAFRGVSEGRVTIKQSEELPEGTYYYILRYKDSAATSFEKAGYLYINR